MSHLLVIWLCWPEPKSAGDVMSRVQRRSISSKIEGTTDNSGRRDNVPGKFLH